MRERKFACNSFDVTCKRSGFICLHLRLASSVDWAQGGSENLANLGDFFVYFSALSLYAAVISSLDQIIHTG